MDRVINPTNKQAIHHLSARITSVGRYYDPATGQFLNVDPLVDATGQPYAYTGDNPVNGVDPMGMCWSLPYGESGPCPSPPSGVNYDSSCLSSAGPVEPGGVRCGALCPPGSEPIVTVTAAGAGGITFEVAGSETLTMSEHALDRMEERGISTEDIQAALEQDSFQYFYDGGWRTGFYDASGGTFVGSVDGTITTVINNVKPSYIQNLQSAAPSLEDVAGSAAGDGAAAAGEGGEGIAGDLEGDAEGAVSAGEAILGDLGEVL